MTKLKKIQNTLTQLCIFSTLFFSCHTAFADHYYEDHGWYLRDTVSGLAWLDFEFSADSSYNDRIAEMGPGGRFEGWRHATFAEVKTLLNHLDYNHYVPLGGWSAANEGITDIVGNLMGFTSYYPGWDQVFAITGSWHPNAPNGGWNYYVILKDVNYFNNATQQYQYADYVSGGASSWSAIAPGWLVNGNPGDLEPPAFWIADIISESLYINSNPIIADSGNLVWEAFDGTVYRLAGYNGSNVSYFDVTSQVEQQPNVSDNGLLTWRVFDGTTWYIMICHAGTMHPPEIIYQGTDPVDTPMIDNDGNVLFNVSNGSGSTLYRYSASSGSSGPWGYSSTGLYSSSNDGGFAWVSSLGTGGGYGIYYYDGTNSHLIGSSSYPVSSIAVGDGGYVTWTGGNASGGYDLWSYAHGGTGSSSIIGSSTHSYDDLQINNTGSIIWTAFNGDGTDKEIFRHIAGTTDQLTTDNDEVIDIYLSDTGIIVYCSKTPNGDWEIIVIDGDKTSRITYNDTDDLKPSISPDGKIVWVNGDEIYLASRLGSNSPPDAVDDAISTDEDTSVEINIVANDTDVDGNLDSTTITLQTEPTNGTVSNNGDGTVSYHPNPDFNGVDSFTYQICDTENECDMAVVTITVNSVNDAPVATDDAFITDEDVILNIAAPGVLINDSDLDGDILSAILLTSTSNGTIEQNVDGSFSYTPDINFNGTDSYTYQACDSSGLCDDAVVSITINPVNDAPNAIDDNYITNQGVEMIVSAPGVLENDIDVDGDALSVSTFNATSVNGGNVSMNPDGSFTYTPASNFAGFDSFEYSISDGNGGTDTGRVNIEVMTTNQRSISVDFPDFTLTDTNLSGYFILNNQSGSGYDVQVNELAVAAEYRDGNSWVPVGLSGCAFNPGIGAVFSDTLSINFSSCSVSQAIPTGSTLRVIVKIRVYGQDVNNPNRTDKWFLDRATEKLI